MALHNCQDFAPELLPVANECVSKPNSTKLYAGTSKTTTTTLEAQYADSTRSVWACRCHVCGKTTVFCANSDGGHLEQAIGEWRDDVSEDRPGTVCRSCLVPINPRFGYWLHRSPTDKDGRPRVGRHLGLHIPQPIMPAHFADPGRWRTLLRKRDGHEPGYTVGRYYNEVLGEPWDQAHRLIGRNELAAIATLGPNTLAEAVRVRATGRYSHVALSIDWGGGGEEGVSQTAIAAVGRAPSGRMEIFYGEKFQPSGNRIGEVDRVVAVAQAVRPDLLAHDYNGLGASQEAILHMRGWPSNRTMPIVYNQVPGQLVIDFVPESGARTRGFYHLDKARSLQMTTQSMKVGWVLAFQDDYVSPTEPGILNDFHNLVAETFQGPTREYFRVRQALPSTPDDFAQAANMGCWALWHLTGTKPHLDR